LPPAILIKTTQNGIKINKNTLLLLPRNEFTVNAKIEGKNKILIILEGITIKFWYEKESPLIKPIKLIFILGNGDIIYKTIRKGTNIIA
jgi:hypothetical protein